MHAHYVDLFRELHDYSGDTVTRDVLLPWLDSHRDERQWLTEFSQRSGSPIPHAEHEELWRLYALSRIAETLLLPFQRGNDDGGQRSGPPVSINEVIAFFEALGLTVHWIDKYSAFHHEIVEVNRADEPSQAAHVVRRIWPCLMLGPMLLLRGGVVVSAGCDVVDASVAATSTLYWAHRRRHRLCEDLSHGWGSNSQWRTALRRDYQLDGWLHFNVDGTVNLAEADCPPIEGDDLTRDERIELLVHRHFVKAIKPHIDRWPYDDRLRVRDPGSR